MKIKSLFLCVVCLLTFEFAAKAQDFEVAPVELIFRTNAGDSEEKNVRITNHASYPQNFQIVLTDFNEDDYGKREKMAPNSTANSCADWLRFEGAFELAPNESRTIPVTMQVPAGDNTTRWAMAYLQTVEERTSLDHTTVSAGLSISARIGIKIYRLPPGHRLTAMKISNLKETSAPEEEQKTFVVSVHNPGDYIGTCKITFIALNLKTAEQHRFDGGSLQILPGNRRIHFFHLPQELPPGEYSLSAIMDYGNKDVLEGTRMRDPLVITNNSEETD